MRIVLLTLWRMTFTVFMTFVYFEWSLLLYGIYVKDNYASHAKLSEDEIKCRLIYSFYYR